MKVNGKYAASNFFVQQGITLDTENKCFNKTNKIISLFTIKEECKKLPQLDYILMFRTLFAKCESCGVDDFENNSVVQLSLVYNKTKKIIIHETQSLEEVKQIAEQLSKVFNLKIKDSASDRRNPKWLN
jgi:hypothetical protein